MVFEIKTFFIPRRYFYFLFFILYKCFFVYTLYLKIENYQITFKITKKASKNRTFGLFAVSQFLLSNHSATSRGKDHFRYSKPCYSTEYMPKSNRKFGLSVKIKNIFVDETKDMATLHIIPKN